MVVRNRMHPISPPKIPHFFCNNIPMISIYFAIPQNIYPPIYNLELFDSGELQFYRSNSPILPDFRGTALFDPQSFSKNLDLPYRRALRVACFLLDTYAASISTSLEP